VPQALRHTANRMRRSLRSIEGVVAIMPLAVCCASSAQASDPAGSSDSPRAHISTELTEAKAATVMAWNIRRVCKAVEYKVSAIEIKPGFPHAKVHLKVKNGKCTQSSVVRSTCKGSRWTSQSDVDMSMLGQPYFVCNTQAVWQTNKHTNGGVCWNEVGKPTDTNAIITATRYLEVGYDSRGALRWRPGGPPGGPNFNCRVS
jgi:hypothetical protein